MRYSASSQVFITLYHTALSRKSTLPKILMKGLLLLDSKTFLHKHACQCFQRRTDRRKWLNGAHRPANFYVSTKQFMTVYCQGNLQNVRYCSSAFDKGSLERRSCSTSGSPSPSSKWDSEGQNFVENENEYFHLYLESVDEYHPYILSCSLSHKADTLPCETVVKLLQEVREKRKVDTLLLLLSHWSGVARTRGSSVLSDRSFSQTVTLLHRNIQLFSTEELLQSLVYLNSLGFRRNMLTTEPRRNRITVSKTFDQACCKKMKEMDIRQLLLAADFFYSVRGSSFTEFPFLMCGRVRLLLPTMSKAELILLLFHMSMARRTLPNMVHTVLDHLHPYLPSLTLQELAIVNLAHYKTQSLVKHPEYFSVLTARLRTEVDLEADPICLCAVLKYQHRSVNRRKDQLLPQFFTAMQDMEGPLLRRLGSNLSSETLMRVLNLYYTMDLLSEDLFMAVVRSINHGGVQDWRLKDMAKVMHILTNVPLGSESTGEAIGAMLADLQRTARTAELQDHPQHLLHIAVSLTFQGIYPHWLLARVFGSSAQKYFTASKTDYSQHLYHLSQSVTIEDSSYQGPLLQPDSFPRLAKNKVYKKLAEWRQGLTDLHGGGGSTVLEPSNDDVTLGSSLYHRDLILVDLMDAMCQARPHVTPVPTFLLPHFFTADVDIVHKWKVKEDEGESTMEDGHHLKDKNFVREAVVLHASNAYQKVRYSDGSTSPLLLRYHAMRARQLRALGIRVIEVSHFEFETSTDKQQYLVDKFQQEKKASHNHHH